MTRLAIIIPVKSLRDGKSRLANTMSALDRQALNLRLLRHTLDQVAGLKDDASAYDVSVYDVGVCDVSVYVVSRSPEVLAEAIQRGFSTCLEPAICDLNAAVTLGAQHAREAGASEIMVLPIDLPWLSTASLAAAIADFRVTADVMIFTDRLRDGTNLLLWRPIETACFHYGVGSAARHVQAALQLGLRVDMRDDPTLSFDLDTPQDLASWSAGQSRSTSPKRMVS